MEARIKELRDQLKNNPAIAHQIVGEVSKMNSEWYQLLKEVNRVIDGEIRAKRQIKSDKDIFFKDRCNQVKFCWMDCQRDTKQLRNRIRMTPAFKTGMIDETKLQNLVYQDSHSGLSFHEVMTNLYSIVRR